MDFFLRKLFWVLKCCCAWELRLEITRLALTHSNDDPLYWAWPKCSVSRGSIFLSPNSIESVADSTQPMDNPIPSIKLRFPSKKSYLIIYYIFYLIKILLFTFFVLEKRKEITKNYLAQADLCICTSITAKPYFA